MKDLKTFYQYKRAESSKLNGLSGFVNTFEYELQTLASFQEKCECYCLIMFPLVFLSFFFLIRIGTSEFVAWAVIVKQILLTGHNMMLHFQRKQEIK